MKEELSEWRDSNCFGNAIIPPIRHFVFPDTIARNGTLHLFRWRNCVDLIDVEDKYIQSLSGRYAEYTGIGMDMIGSDKGGSRGTPEYHQVAEWVRIDVGALFEYYDPNRNEMFIREFFLPIKHEDSSQYYLTTFIPYDTIKGAVVINPMKKKWSKYVPKSP